MNQGLFESLTGQFLDGTPVDSVPQKSRRILSIMDHLKRLFNTREGSLAHLEDYGLPDISEIYRKMPDGIDELRDAIKRAVEKHEPRLKNIRVVQREAEGVTFSMEFILSAELREGGLVRFQTVFTSTGNSSVSPWRKVE
jgi:type VI secretion system protein